MYTFFRPANYSRPSKDGAAVPFPSDNELLSGSLVLTNVLPAQFYSPSGSEIQAPGEVALMRAVLEDAIHCFYLQFVTTRRRALRLAKEAEAWLFSDDVSWPFSFTNICGVLDLEPAYIRRGLMRWRRRPPTTVQRRRRRRVTPRYQAHKIAA